MQLPTAETGLGNFDDVTFTKAGVTTRFYRQGGLYKVRTEGEDGEPETFTVQYVFGVYPLQQYLLPLSRGRLQALSIAWDARPVGQGGQRWFHLYPDEVIAYDDPLHWTGPFQNWNSRCAECHSTHLVKNYSAQDRSFATTFEEIDVGCEACHGPGERHIKAAKAGQLARFEDSGFDTSLAASGEWVFSAEKDIALRTEPRNAQGQVDSCGRCHARRGTLGAYRHGEDLLATHQLLLPRPPFYHLDGQVLDENFVYGSFVQSKMFNAGVVCSDCHEPHSQTLRSPGNGVCAQCHQVKQYDTPAHHHHLPESSGALCANCHMPETTYMVVDPRRDHSLRIPRPDLSLTTGTPNACTGCHTNKDAQWAVNSLDAWGVALPEAASAMVRALQQVEQGNRAAVPVLSALVNDSAAAPIWRATGMEALGDLATREVRQTATVMLLDENPLLRVSAVRSLAFLPLAERYQMLRPVLADEVAAVRMEVAMSLAGVPLNQVNQTQAKQLQALFDWLLSIFRLHADMPETQLQLGDFYAQRGQLSAAEKAYREAIDLNPLFISAHLNLADLLRGQNRDEQARKILLSVLAFAPDHGATLYSLGLLETRSKSSDKALEYLGRAAELETAGWHYRYVYAIALHDLGEPRKAIAQLKELLETQAGNEEVLLALTNYNLQLGQREQAKRFALRLLEIDPRSGGYRQLYQNTLN